MSIDDDDDSKWIGVFSVANDDVGDIIYSEDMSDKNIIANHTIRPQSFEGCGSVMVNSFHFLPQENRLSNGRESEHTIEPRDVNMITLFSVSNPSVTSHAENRDGYFDKKPTSGVPLRKVDYLFKSRYNNLGDPSVVTCQQYSLSKGVLLFPRMALDFINGGDYGQLEKLLGSVFNTDCTIRTKISSCVCSELVGSHFLIGILSAIQDRSPDYVVKSVSWKYYTYQNEQIVKWKVYGRGTYVNNVSTTKEDNLKNEGSCKVHALDRVIQSHGCLGSLPMFEIISTIKMHIDPRSKKIKLYEINSAFDLCKDYHARPLGN